MAAQSESDRNQSSPLADVDLFASNAALRDAVAAAGLGGAFDELSTFGRIWGSAESFDLGRLANENPPRLRTIGPSGERLERVDHHPAYHELMRRSLAAGLHVSSWEGVPQVLRAAQLFMACQIESGHVCPITMTHASLAALRAEPALEALWRPRIAGRTYDPRSVSWREKSSVTLGMAMTEIQGGSDLRANRMQARPIGGAYRLDGEKWFMSAPMSDAFLVLAQAPGGLTCFLAPRWGERGSSNGIRLERLKDKLGNRSNASSEARFEDAEAWRVGEEGEGLRTILAMVQMTRLDCAVASAGLMRLGLAQAIDRARRRKAFGRALVDQPAMRALLADLALELEAATALVMRLARAAGDPENPFERAYARLMIPAAKYLVCKTAPGFLYECMECLGGNGYVEDWPLARAYREAPVNSIWEGSGSIVALDVLRAARRDRPAAEMVTEAIGGRDAPRLIEELARGQEPQARRLSEELARSAARAALRSVAPDLAEAHERRWRGAAAATWGCADLSEVERKLIARIDGG